MPTAVVIGNRGRCTFRSIGLSLCNGFIANIVVFDPGETSS